ncbi:MAG: hypothetical protein ACJ74H_15160 [Thermoanaerobaculia bacterium]
MLLPFLDGMGDETKERELAKGNTRPLDAPRKPSTARDVEEEPEPIARVPQNRGELPRNDNRE